jgi:hypothetical protein
VVIDEAHLTFNARDFAQTDKLYRETLTFLTQSRKVNTDVIFIAQSVLNMDKQFMRLVQFIWRFRDLAKWKIPGLGINYPFKQILAVQFDYDGKTILQRSFVNKDKRIFGLYNTNSLIREFPRLEATNTNRKLAQVAVPKGMMKFLVPLGVIFGVICAFVLYKKVSNIGTPKQPTVAANAATTTPVSTLRSVNTTTQSTTQDKDKIQYDVYTEQFQAWNGSERALKTKESGWYQVGEMSSRGFVNAVSDRRARIAQPDGRTGWVVATGNPQDTQTSNASVAASTSPSPTERGALAPDLPASDKSIPPTPIPSPQPTTPITTNDDTNRALRAHKTGRRYIPDKVSSGVDKQDNQRTP